MNVNFRIFEYILVKIIMMRNIHKPCNFLIVFMVTWSKNEQSESLKRFLIVKYIKENHGVVFVVLQIGSFHTI